MKYNIKDLFHIIFFISKEDSSMPRIPRMYLDTEYFHVITQGINKSYIFDCPIDIIKNNKEECKEILEKILLEKSMSLEEIKKSEDELYRLIVILKRDYKVSLREIAINLNLNREKVRKIFNK